MMAPLTVLDYIIVHERPHLRHPNHTVAFWDAVDKVLPDYRERKAWVRGWICSPASKLLHSLVG